MLSVTSATRVLVATTPVDLRGSFNRTARSWGTQRGDLHFAGQLSAAGHQSV